MMKMMERMNFVMGNMCDIIEKVGKYGNVVGTCTQDIRKVGAEPKSNNGIGVERPMWVDYEDFKEDVDDIGDGGFKDETIGHREGFRQPRNRILISCYGKRKGGFKRRGCTKLREIKRLVF